MTTPGDGGDGDYHSVKPAGAVGAAVLSSQSVTRVPEDSSVTATTSSSGCELCGRTSSGSVLVFEITEVSVAAGLSRCSERERLAAV